MRGLLAWSVFLISVGVSWADTAPIELLISPPGVLKKGVTFNITCELQDYQDYDVVRIIRIIKNPETGQDETITLSSNGHVRQEFADTGRYKDFSNFDAQTFTVMIKDAQGVDGGRLGCEHAASRSGEDIRNTAAEYVTIFVPVESVHIRSKSSNGDWIPVEDEGKVVMRHGFEDGVECWAEVIGSDIDITPSMTFKIGNLDATTYKHVEHDTEYEKSMDGKQVKRVFRTWYKFESTSPDKAFNGEDITCSAQIKEYEKVTTTATLAIEYAPDVACRTTTYAKLGDENVKVTCKATMSPEPTASFWSWGSVNKTMLNTGELTEGFSAEQKQLGNNEWEFYLVVSKVDADILQEFSFSVENGLGEPVSETAALEEAFETTTTPEPTEPPTPKPKPTDPISDPSQNGQIGESVSGSANACVFSFGILLISILTNIICRL